jgi:hypothetical protein
VSHLGGCALSSGRSLFDDLPHVGHFIVGEAVIAPIIEVEMPSHALLIVVRVHLRRVISLIAKTLSEATRSLGRAGLSVVMLWGWQLVYRHQHRPAFVRRQMRKRGCRESPLFSLCPFGRQFIVGVSEVRPHVVSQLGLQVGNLLLVILQVLVLGLASVNQPRVFVAQILVFVLELIELLGHVLEPTREVSVVLDKGPG